jgi:hypothetical protein
MATAHDFRLIADSRVQALNVLFGHNKDMSGCLCINVFKGEGVVILVNLLGWNLTGNDSAKKAVGHGYPCYAQSGN